MTGGGAGRKGYGAGKEGAKAGVAAGKPRGNGVAAAKPRGRAIEAMKPRGNFWEGHFPDKNTDADGYYGAAPVGSFAPNGYGLVDMAGDVWEWCEDYYKDSYYKEVAGSGAAGLGSGVEAATGASADRGVVNPQGPATSYDPEEPYAAKRVIRGGSFLCNESYCTGYRVSRRMKSTEDSGMEHVGFRAVSD